jgi:hypothetical protein
VSLTARRRERGIMEKMSIEELATRIPEMDQGQIEQTLEGYKVAEIQQLVKVLGLKGIRGSKDNQILTIAKLYGFKDLFRRMGERPKHRMTMI